MVPDHEHPVPRLIPTVAQVTKLVPEASLQSVAARRNKGESQRRRIPLVHKLATNGGDLHCSASADITFSSFRQFDVAFGANRDGDCPSVGALDSTRKV